MPISPVNDELSGVGADGVVRQAVYMWATELVFFTTWLRAAGRTAQTIRLRRYWVARLAQELESTDPYAVTADELIDWLAFGDWKPETRKSARASVVAFYRWAVEAERIKPRRNPARKLPKVTVPAGLPRPAPDSRLKRALWAANDRERLMIKLAAYAGLRRGEIARVHPDDVDWQRAMLRVEGKGGKVRHVPLVDELLAELGDELTRRRHGSCGSGWRYTRHVRVDGCFFPGRDGGPVSPCVVGKVLSRLLGGSWTGHTLRHRFATEAHAADHDLRAVQELLGHSKPETTARYTLVSDDAKRRAVTAAARTA